MPGEDGSVKSRFGEHVAVAVDGPVAVVTIDRPPHNHISIELLEALIEAFAEIDAGPALRCSVLQTAGKNFCAGADLENAGKPGVVGMADADRLYENAARLFAVEKPIVAAVQGAAVGAGLGLALVADFRVAANDARFSATFVKLGFHPGFGLTLTLPRLVGQSKAGLMFLTGRRLKADEALASGLVEAVVPPKQLGAAALRLAHEIAENAPLAVVATRKTLRGDLAAAVLTQTKIEYREQASLWPTEDFQEGVRAMAERRPAVFVGR
jgi:enoyl-CoA hydratase/carnithine racemase